MSNGESARDGAPVGAPAPVDTGAPIDSGAPVGTPRRSAGLSLLASEITVLFRRKRTLAMLGALAAVPILIAVAVRINSSGTNNGRGPAFLDSITHNGLFVAVLGLTVCIPLFLPLTVGVVAGDTIAGEASAGTLRYLLIAPAGRIRLLVVKYLGSAVFALAATLVVVIAGAVIGAILFPIGPVVLLSGTTIGVGDSIIRSLYIAAFVTVSLLGLSAIGLFLSSLTDVPVGAMAATIVLSIVSQVLDNLPQVDWIHPYLFSHYWLSFADLLRDPISWTSFGQNAVLQGAYLVIFAALAYGRFSTKDILS